MESKEIRFRISVQHFRSLGEFLHTPNFSGCTVFVFTIEDPLPDVPEDSPVRRVLYATLMTVTGKPAAHVLHQSEYSTSMDGLGALKALRVKYEPIQKSAFRKSLIFDVVFFQITASSNPEK